MIATGNPELDAVIATISEQRNTALDSVAILSGKLRVQEQLTAALQKQLVEIKKRKKQPEAKVEGA